MAGFFKPAMVKAQVGGRTVTLDTYSVPLGDDSSTTYTRMSVALQNMDGFEFHISRTGIVAQLDKALGAQDIEIGDAEFDRLFTIRGKNEAKVRAFLGNMRIRQLLQEQKSGSFFIRKGVLRYEAQGFIKDVERLRSMFELFREALAQLEG